MYFENKDYNHLIMGEYSEIPGGMESLEMLFERAGVLRGKMGGQGALLDEFLKRMLQGFTALLAREAEQEGEAAAGLLAASIQMALVCNHASWRIDNWVHEFPLPVEDTEIARAVYMGLLADRFLKTQLPLQEQFFLASIQKKLDGARCKELYEKIARLTGARDKLDSLCDEIRALCGIGPLLRAYVSAYHRHVLAHVFDTRLPEHEVLRLLLDARRPEKWGMDAPGNSYRPDGRTSKPD